MDLNLKKLKYSFTNKPILVGGKAMEYYGLRKSGDDIDLLVTSNDLFKLINIYPNRVKDIWGDLGVCPYEFEIWKTIFLYDYDYFLLDAKDDRDFLVISIEKLLFLKTLTTEKEKHVKDAKLISDYLLKSQYKNFEKIKKENELGLSKINNLIIIQKESK